MESGSSPVPELAKPDWRRSKWLSALEVALATFVVIGHNVFHIVPNEVVVLFIVGWISLRVRGGGWKSIGLTRPRSWTRTIIAALATAVFLQLLSEFVTEPLITHFTHRPPDLSEFKNLPGNSKVALLYLAAIWTFAAFGEEMVYRGYILNRGADLGDRTTKAYIIALAYVTVLFGLGHYYQGVSGVLDTAVTSIVLGTMYLLFQRNLWVAILAHGFSDTIAVGLIYFGFFKIR
jgi:membrane protease YdiL (CAAX protease family)